MRKSFGATAALAASLWIVSTPSASAQMWPEESGVAAPDVWSSRYRRFLETQNETPPMTANGLTRPPGNMLAPPDILICEPQNSPLPPERSVEDKAGTPQSDVTIGAR
jgi:hypothetical protein